MKTRISIWLVTVLCALSMQAQENSNSRQARKMFDELYEKVFGEQGATLHYNVNVASLYKTEGTIWYKGKKSKYESKASKAWNDGVTVHVIRGNKKEVEIYATDDPKQSRFGDDFKFEPENYTYSIANDPEGYLITLRGKKGVKAMKEIRVILDKATRTPRHLNIKVAFIWAKVQISNFKLGGITNDTFTFPRNTYKDYKLIDKRGS